MHAWHITHLSITSDPYYISKDIVKALNKMLRMEASIIQVYMSTETRLFHKSKRKHLVHFINKTWGKALNIT